MGTILSSRNFYFQFRNSFVLSDIGKKIFSENYYGKVAYYREALSQYTNFASYIDLFNHTITLGSIHTLVDIQAGVLNSHNKDVISIYGRPSYIFTEREVAIYIYKWRFNNLKTRCEIHFYKNKAFLINYNYSQIDNNGKDFILRNIKSKYLKDFTNSVTLGDSKIVDRNNNVLFINDSTQGFKISYLSNSECDWYEGLSSKMNLRQNKQKSRAIYAERSFYNKI